MTATATANVTKPRTLGVAGCIAGLLALFVALLPQWILPAILPVKPVDQIVVEVGQGIKERIAAKAKGIIFHKTQQKSALAAWSQMASIAAVTLGLLAIAFAVFSILRREERLPAGMAAVLGIGAILAQITLMVIGALIMILIVYAVLDHIDIF
jgi:hypothetical protein